MVVAFDAFSNSASGTTDRSWTHTVVGTPKAIIVFVLQALNSNDTVTGVTYGGTSMTELSGSPNLKATGETGGVYAYFLGSSIPTGNQTVTVSSTGSGTKIGVCYSLTAGADTQVEDVDATINTDSQSNPSITLSLSSKSCFCALGGFSGIGDVTGVTPLSSWTSRLESSGGGVTALTYSYDTIGTSDVSAGWTQLADDAIMIAVAVTEVTSGTNMTVNVGDVEKTITAIQVNVGDVWKDVTSVQVNVGDVWKTIF